MQSTPPNSTAPVLASDLDGTFIPLSNDPRNRRDLRILSAGLRQRSATLVYVTGRHLESVAAAMAQFDLPQPDWIICDVGTSIFRSAAAGRFLAVEEYAQHQDRIIAELPIAALRDRVSELPGLRLQEPEKQGRFKLSYYAAADRLDELVERVQQILDLLQAPYSIIHSVDPFNGDGLMDLLPRGVSKAHALDWWCAHHSQSPESVVFAGDTGNDFAAMTAGYRTIIVSNADRLLARDVQAVHRQAGWTDRLYLARQTATSGVLEGCRHWRLID